jgi:hypothetical protein
MARKQKGPEGVAANRPQAAPTMGQDVLGGEGGNGHAEIEGIGGLLSDAGKLSAEVGEVVGADLGNFVAIAAQPGDVACDLGKKLRHGATPAVCGDDNEIVPQRGECVNLLHSAARKYVNAGIAIFPVSAKGRSLQPSTTDAAEVDRWFHEAAEAEARIEASRAMVKAAEAAKAKAYNAERVARDNEALAREALKKAHDKVLMWEFFHGVAKEADATDDPEALAEKHKEHLKHMSARSGSDPIMILFAIRGELHLFPGRIEAAKASEAAAKISIADAQKQRADADRARMAAGDAIRAEEAKIKAEPEAPAALRLAYGYTVLQTDGAVDVATLSWEHDGHRVYVFDGSRFDIGDLGNGAAIINGPDLPLDIEPTPIAPVPAWVTEAWWGEDHRGSQLDCNVEAAKRFLAMAERETDGPHRIKKEQAKVNRKLGEDLYDHDRADLERRRDALEEEEPTYETTREVANKLIDFGLSKARATVLMRVEWNPRNRPELPDAIIREAIDEAWKDAEQFPDSVARKWRWQFRDRKEAGSVDDLLHGDIAEKDWLLGRIMAAGSRTMLYGATGKGKTMVCMAMAMRVAAGQDFVHWQGSRRPRKVVYVDGDMSYDDMRRRVRGEYVRMGEGADISGFRLLNHEKVKLPKLDTPEGQRVVDAFIEEHGADLVVFDNMQSLLSGITTASWAQVLDWTKELTARGIAQLWQHHTGRDGSHAYGDVTREWGLDFNIQLRTHKAEPGELIVSLAFEKPGRDIRDTDHNTVQVQLISDRWASSGGIKPGSNRAAMIQGLLIENGHVDPEHRIWEPELAALISPNDVEAEKKRLQNNHRERPYAHLCVKDGQRWYWFLNTPDQD